MIRQMMKLFLVFNLMIFAATSSFAQGANSADAKPGTKGPRKQLATILFTGLGGAVLGLSTLSFYGRPQDKLENIAIGFAVGVILGTSYVTYKAATSPAEFYGTQSQLERDSLGLAQRETPRTPFMASYDFTF
ncbi:MAG: hypothetical protein V4692_08030 [Bdellovibrionota bacterium]